eukprot:2249951-Rhodomonas_salina.2
MGTLVLTDGYTCTDGWVHLYQAKEALEKFKEELKAHQRTMRAETAAKEVQQSGTAQSNNNTCSTTVSPKRVASPGICYAMSGTDVRIDLSGTASVYGATHPLRRVRY